MHIGLGLALACSLLQAAAAANWKLDPTGSRLEFAASFEKTPAPGRFKTFDVYMRLEPQKLADSRLDVSIQVASADMINPDINQAIAGVEWFDFARHQQAEFHASDIRALPPGAPAGNYLARGTLELKGVRQMVDVPFSWSAAGDGATMAGEFSLRRGVFGIGTGEWAAADVIGAEVIVKFRVRLRQVP
jgi:polyisoprenoid-binding protein YceI